MGEHEPQNHHQHIVKKLKHATTEDHIPEDMELQDGEPTTEALHIDHLSHGQRDYSPTCRIPVMPTPIYIWAMTMRRNMRASMSCFAPLQRMYLLSSVPRSKFPRRNILAFFSKWRGALIIKLLGKSISYRLLEQRVKEIWQLRRGFELSDLEEGYFIVRFYSREDYLHVLEGGP